MGYTTEFYGRIRIEPPLNKEEIEFLTKFSRTRRMNRRGGPYFVDGTEDFGQGHDPDIIEYNTPPPGQPGLWCQWLPSDDGEYIEWDGGEKFYNAAEWMTYIIEHFLKLGATGNAELTFLKDHICNGEIEAQGEYRDDLWLLKVTDNVVTTAQGTITYK